MCYVSKVGEQAVYLTHTGHVHPFLQVFLSATMLFSLKIYSLTKYCTERCAVQLASC
jgi:hypothetical protein